ncbi:MAG: radical SAM protein [Deltaproteobacteria bacterium]|nr:radical SAM protein [Deltaproteobacteria bacterium]
MANRLINWLKTHWPPTPRVATPDLPTEVILEVTNNCNLACRMCHFHGRGVVRKRPKGFMAPDLWHRVVDQLAGWGRPVNLSTFGAGEPLLYPGLFDLVSYVKTKPQITVGFLTNGMLFNESAARRTLDLGMDWVGFSLDGLDEQMFKDYRINADLSTVERSVVTLADLRAKSGGAVPRIKLNMVLVPGMENQVDAYLDKWLPLVDEIMFSTCRPVGRRDFLPPDPQRVRRPCHLLCQMMVITWTGDVALCCEDIFADVVLGRAAKDDLAGVWSGEAFSRVRRLHRQGRYAALPLCQDCDTWSTDQFETWRDEARGCTVNRNGAQFSYVKDPS